MKILHAVESYPPVQSGMAEVCRQISERLVQAGHEVTVVTTKIHERKESELNGVKVRQFNVSGNYVRGMQGEIDEYISFIKSIDFDIVTFFAAQTWTTDLALPYLKEIKGKKVFVPTGFSGLHFPAYRKYYKQMIDRLKEFDNNIFLSNDYRDINYAKKNQVTNYIIIPNGADGTEFLSDSDINFRYLYKIPEDDFMILHVGSRTGFKGHTEALDIFRKAKIKNSTLVMIGNSASGLYSSLMKYFNFKLKRFNADKTNKANNKQILILNTSRSETVSAFKQADLFLFPSNIECSPLVLFESMAGKTPFLVTDVGNSKEIVEWTNGGIILPTKKCFGLSRAKLSQSAKILENIFNNPELRKTMAALGFKAWSEKFTWEKIAKKYEELYSSLL
ncbi:MAG: glycosyltransferase family 4 protein [Bacteroidota bacterium]